MRPVRASIRLSGRSSVAPLVPASRWIELEPSSVDPTRMSSGTVSDHPSGPSALFRLSELAAFASIRRLMPIGLRQALEIAEEMVRLAC